jgi:hypothetical protein
VSITNMDWAGCPASTFNLADALPVGWTGSVSPSSLTLAPGALGSATLSVSSPATAAAGTYGLTVSASDAATTSHTGSAAASYVVSVSCTQSAPSLTVSPSSQSGAAGASLSYAVSLTNADGSGCGSSTFSLGHTLPSGWSGSIAPATLTLAPGQLAAASLTVTSAAGALAGSYSVTASVSDGAVSGHTASDNAIDTVTLPSDTQAPTAPTGLTAALKRNQVKLAWNPSTDNVGVAAYDVWRSDNNTAPIASTSATSYTDGGLGSGSYTYYVVARDAADNASGPSNAVTVTVGGSSGKGGNGGGGSGGGGHGGGKGH